MSKPKKGDRVVVITKDEEIEGLLMPRPEILEDDVVIIKLDNGYNIGIDKKRIKELKLLKPYKPKCPLKVELKHKKSLPTVSVLSTGGTISSRVDYRTGGVYADYTAEDFVAMCPELEKIANLKAEKLMSGMSEDFCHEEWKKIAKSVAKALNNGSDGVVVTQGTDTLHYTTAALSFFLKNLSKPVVVTGSQRSIDRGSSDAFMNLVCSINAAANFEGAEVMTCLHGTTNDDYCLLNRGTKVRKMHTSRRDAFRPMDELPLAKVHAKGKIEVVNKAFKKRSKEKVAVDDKFEPKIAMVYVHPGMDPGVVDYYVSKGFKGLVIAATALGHVPTSSQKNLIEPLMKAVEKGIPVVVASQTLYGRVHPLVYTNLRKLSLEVKSIFVEDMLPEVAYIKLGWALGHTKDMVKVKEMMLTNYAGEISERSTPKSFLY